MYLETYYKHQPWNVQIDEIPAKVRVQELQIVD